MGLIPYSPTIRHNNPPNRNKILMNQKLKDMDIGVNKPNLFIGFIVKKIALLLHEKTYIL